ncbi:S6 Kinase Like [Carabus blaptoides fortunei]
MGNSNRKHSVGNIRNSNSTNANRHRVLEQNISDFSFNVSGRSFASVNSQHSTYSVSRPWSRVSRRRWKESTLTVPFEASKTAWPVSNIESLFLPEFPVSPPISENFVQIVEFIAYGAFGKVYKVQGKTSDEFYALKVLSKSKIINENSIQQVKDEVQIQRVCGHHSFIVNCPFHWQTRKRLYIVSDFIEGGELHQLCETYGILPVTVVQIFIAEIALALVVGTCNWWTLDCRSGYRTVVGRRLSVEHYAIWLQRSFPCNPTGTRWIGGLLVSSHARC